MSAAKVMILPPGSNLYPAADDHQQLLVILRGAIHTGCTAQRAGQGSQRGSSPQGGNVQQPAAKPDLLLSAEQPRLYNQTNAAGLQIPGAASTISREQQQTDSGHPHSGAGQADPGRAGPSPAGQAQTGQSQTGQSQTGHMPSGSSSSSSSMQDKDILDARGCAFGLPGLLQGTALEVHVTAETVVEAYSIPWSLIQVGFSAPYTQVSHAGPDTV